MTGYGLCDGCGDTLTDRDMLHGVLCDHCRKEPTVAYHGDQEIYLDDKPREGARIGVREDFDDEDSPVYATYTLHKEGNTWLLV